MVNKILVIRLGVIGDLILTSPAILNLKISFPRAKISLLTRNRFSSLARRLIGVDEIFDFPNKATLRDLYLMGEFLDNQNFDMIIDLHGNIRSQFLSKYVTASIKGRYWKRSWERMAAVNWHWINPYPPHTVDLYNTAVTEAGGKVFARRPVLRLDDCEKKSIEFENNRPIIAIAPGASHQPKKFPKERLRDIAIESFERFSANIVLFLVDDDADMESLGQIIPRSNLKSFRNYDLNRLPCLISECDLMLCNDSGLMHMSSAVGTPVLGFFGPTHPTLGFSPRGLKDQIVETDEYCRPCSRHGKQECFRDKQYCFENISDRMILNMISEAIKDNHKGDKALFIDRDGTLIKDKNYMSNPALVEPEEGSIDAVKLARKLGFKIIVVSNQSGVARGYFDEQTVMQVNQKVMDIFKKAEAEIDGIYYCPHYQNGVEADYSFECSCRKPSAGMIEKASLEHQINPFRSYVIGDKPSDIQLAQVSGGKGILVRTGYGVKSEKDFELSNLPPSIYIADNLYEAVKYLETNSN
ncbi:MAG: HAD-IIIA family hydrolase [Candidatus Zixiibacteriota bacterium]